VLWLGWRQCLMAYGSRFYLNGALTALGLIESPDDATRAGPRIQFPGLAP
jgi:hypothetical protein